MKQLCAPPDAARELLAKATGPSWKPGDLVLGQIALNWGFQRASKPRNWRASPRRPGKRPLSCGRACPRAAWAYPTQPATGAAGSSSRPYTYGFTFTQPACLRLGLAAEEQGFTKLWSNAEYSLYENPALGAKRPPYAERILGHYNLYDQVAIDAINRKDWANAHFALQQGMPYAEGDQAGRRQALLNVDKQLGLKP